MAVKAKKVENYKGINLHTMKVRVLFFTPILGSTPTDPEVYVDYIANKIDVADSTLSDEEVKALVKRKEMMLDSSQEEDDADVESDRGMTVFPRDDDGTPIFWNYQWRGFFKEACSMLRKDSDKLSSLITAFKKEVDGRIFIKERKIPIKFEGEIGDCHRTLRATTAKGDRVAISHSESIPAGAMCEFIVGVMDEKMLDIVKEWLEYGSLHGMGQWRSSGLYGRFFARTMPTGDMPLSEFSKQVGKDIDVDAFYDMDLSKPLFE